MEGKNSGAKVLSKRSRSSLRLTPGEQQSRPFAPVLGLRLV